MLFNSEHCARDLTKTFICLTAVWWFHIDSAESLLGKKTQYCCRCRATLQASFMISSTYPPALHFSVVPLSPLTLLLVAPFCLFVIQPLCFIVAAELTVHAGDSLQQP